MDEICSLKNVLQKEKRKQLIENSQSLFTQTNNTQTPPILQLHYKFVPILQDLLHVINDRTKLNLEMMTAWMLKTKGEEGGWHNHSRDGADYSMIYYIKSPLFFTGTLFKHGIVKSSQNSILLFPSHLDHMTPPHPFGIERYVLSADFIVK